MQAGRQKGVVAEGILHAKYREGKRGQEGYWWVQVRALGYRIICGQDDIRIEGEWMLGKTAEVHLPGEKTGEKGTRGALCHVGCAAGHAGGGRLAFR